MAYHLTNISIKPTLQTRAYHGAHLNNQVQEKGHSSLDQPRRNTCRGRPSCTRARISSMRTLQERETTFFQNAQSEKERERESKNLTTGCLDIDSRLSPLRVGAEARRK